MKPNKKNFKPEFDYRSLMWDVTLKMGAFLAVSSRREPKFVQLEAPVEN